jgi:hypothetical protein
VEKKRRLLHEDEHIYSLNLMCIKKEMFTFIQQKQHFKSGNLLLGMFLFSLIHHRSSPPPKKNKGTKGTKKNKTNKKKQTKNTIPLAILELAHSYLNLSGLCLYEKFGFTYKEEIREYFDFYNSVIPLLPMSLDLNNSSIYKNKTHAEKKRLILKIVCDCKNPPNIRKSPICTQDPKYQEVLGQLKILFHCMKFNQVHVLLNKWNLHCSIFKNLLNQLFPTRTFQCLTKLKRIVFNKSEIKTVQSLISTIETQPPSVPQKKTSSITKTTSTFSKTTTTTKTMKKKKQPVDNLS